MLDRWADASVVAERALAIGTRRFRLAGGDT